MTTKTGIHPKLVFITCLMTIFMACGVATSNIPKPASMSTPIASEVPFPQSPALSVTLTAFSATLSLDPEYVITNDIKLALRTDNPHAPRVVVISSDYHKKGDLLVSWVIVGSLDDPNLNANVRDDATRVIRTIAQSGFNYTSAVLEAYWPSQDADGAISEKLVVNLIYKKSTIDMINWDTFTPNDIYRIADSSFVDATFQGK